MLEQKPSHAPIDPRDYGCPDDPALGAAWLGALNWTLGQVEALDAFRKATGNTFTPARSPLESMIDDATGAPREFLVEFMKWFHANVWGEEGG